MSQQSSRSRRSAVLAAALLGAVLAAANSPVGAQAPVPISDTSTNPDGGDDNDPVAVTACNRAPQLGVVYRNSEAEPHLAVNPINPSNMIAGWHQDRWSTGAAQSLGVASTFDGGGTWTQVTIPFTRCSGAAPGSTGDYERGSDPWISFGPDGTAYYMALVVQRAVNENAMTVARSSDGGRTWSAPIVIARSPAQDAVGRSLFHDKNTLTADPYDARLVYATWTLFRTGVSSLLVARSTDGGRTWSPAMAIGTMGNTAPGAHTVFRQGAQIVVLPDRSLVNAYYRIVYDEVAKRATFEQAVYRSVDQGKRWTRLDTRVASFTPVTAFDTELGIPVRDAQELPSIAVNRATGQLYMTWQDGNANPGAGAGIVVAKSNDGGATWSAPVRVNQGTAATVQAFLPVVTVNAQGTVGVLYYDWRHDQAGDAALSTDVWLSLFSPELDYLGEHRLTQASFDMRQMAITGSRGFFPGDYVGLSSDGTDFVAAFTVAHDTQLNVAFPQNNNGVFVDKHNRQSIVFVRKP